MVQGYLHEYVPPRGGDIDRRGLWLDDSPFVHGPFLFLRLDVDSDFTAHQQRGGTTHQRTKEPLADIVTCIPLDDPNSDRLLSAKGTLEG